MNQEIKIEVFTGDSLLHRETDVLPIIDGYLWERDVVMLFGNEKAGKSIIGLQAGLAISSGGMFLGKYQCMKRPVVYLQCEGKRDETSMRLEAMMQAVSIDKYNFYRFYKKFLPLDMPEYVKALDAELGKLPIRGGVIIIDCLYMAMMGDLNSNHSVRIFIGFLSELLEKHLLTCVLIHHAKREERDQDGNAVDLGDKASYGSVFLRANVDHILYLEMKKDKTRVFKCDTQRSGKVNASEELILIQPNPLLFQIKGNHSGSVESIYWHLCQGNKSKPELKKILGFADITLDSGLKELINTNRVNIVDEIKSHTGSMMKIFGVLKKNDHY